jgi:two-component system, LuxR family, response regulator FixJ
MRNEQIVAVIDDDESVRQALDGLLRSAGLAVVAFPSGEGLLRWPHLQSAGCLILDLRLPGMNGLDLQQRLNAIGCTMPIIILTSYGDDGERSRALAAGAAAFFVKPVDGEALIAMVESTLRFGTNGRLGS